MWIRLKSCLFDQSTKQPLDNFESWKPLTYKQLWELEVWPCLLIKSVLLTVKAINFHGYYFFVYFHGWLIASLARMW